MLVRDCLRTFRNKTLLVLIVLIAHGDVKKLEDLKGKTLLIASQSGRSKSSVAITAHP